LVYIKKNYFSIYQQEVLPLTNPIEGGKGGQVLWEVYCRLYPKPKTKYAVSIEIYQRFVPSIKNIIDKYTKEGYFKQIKVKDPRTAFKYQSTPKPIIDMLNQQSELSKEEIQALNKFLNSKSFRRFISENESIKDLNTIIFLLSILSINALCLFQYIYYSRDISTENTQKALKSITKIKKRYKVEEEIMNIIGSKVQGYLKLFHLYHYSKESVFNYENNEKLILEICSFNNDLLLKLAQSFGSYNTLVHCMAYAYETANFMSRKKGSFREKPV
jgi:hypothetical protein